MNKEGYQDNIEKAISCCGFLNKKGVAKLRTVDSYNRNEGRIQQGKSNTDYQFQAHNNSKSGTITTSLIPAFNFCSKFDSLEDQQIGSHSNFSKDYTYNSTQHTLNNTMFPGSFSKQNNSSHPGSFTKQNNYNKDQTKQQNGFQTQVKHQVLNNRISEDRNQKQSDIYNLSSLQQDQQQLNIKPLSSEAISSEDNVAYETLEMENIKDLLTTGETSEIKQNTSFETSEIKQNTSFVSMLDNNSSFNKSDQYKLNLSVKGDYISDQSSSPNQQFSQYSQYNQKSFSNLSNQDFSRNRDEISQESFNKPENNYIQYVDYKSNTANKFQLDIDKLQNQKPWVKQQNSNRDHSSSRGQRSSLADQQSIRDISIKEYSSRNQRSSRRDQQSSLESQHSNSKYNSIQPLSFDSIEERGTPSLQFDQIRDQEKGNRLKGDEVGASPLESLLLQKKFDSLDSKDSCQQFEKMIDESKFKSVHSNDSFQNIDSLIKKGKNKQESSSTSVEGGTKNNVVSESLPISQIPDLSKVNWTSRSQSLSKNMEYGYRYINTNSFEGTTTQTQQSSASKNLSAILYQRQNSASRSNLHNSTNNHINGTNTVTKSSQSSNFSVKLGSSQLALQNTINQNLTTGISIDRLYQTMDGNDKIGSKVDTLVEEMQGRADTNQSQSSLVKGSSQSTKHTDKLSILLEEMYSTEQSEMKNLWKGGQENEGELQNQVTRLSIYESRRQYETMMNQSLIDYQAQKQRQDPGSQNSVGLRQQGPKQIAMDQSVDDNMSNLGSNGGKRGIHDDQFKIQMTQKYQELDQEKEKLTLEYQSLQEEYNRRLLEKQKQLQKSLYSIKQSNSIKQQQSQATQQSSVQATTKKGSLQVPFRSSVNVDVSKTSGQPTQNSKSNLFRQDGPQKSPKQVSKYKSVVDDNIPSNGGTGKSRQYQPKSVEEEIEVLSEVLDKRKSRYNHNRHQNGFNNISYSSMGYICNTPQQLNPQSLDRSYFNKRKDADTSKVQQALKNIQQAKELKKQAKRIEQDNVQALLEQQGFLNHRDKKMLQVLLDEKLDRDILNYQHCLKKRHSNEDDYIELPSFSQKLNFNSLH